MARFRHRKSRRRNKQNMTMQQREDSFNGVSPERRQAIDRKVTSSDIARVRSAEMQTNNRSHYDGASSRWDHIQIEPWAELIQFLPGVSIDYDLVRIAPRKDPRRQLWNPPKMPRRRTGNGKDVEESAPLIVEELSASDKAYHDKQDALNKHNVTIWNT